MSQMFRLSPSFSQDTQTSHSSQGKCKLGHATDSCLSGLAKSVLEKSGFPILSGSQHAPSLGPCSFCLQEISSFDRTITCSACRYTFHAEGMLEWTISRAEAKTDVCCPTCRAIIVQRDLLPEIQPRRRSSDELGGFISSSPQRDLDISLVNISYRHLLIRIAQSSLVTIISREEVDLLTLNRRHRDEFERYDSVPGRRYATWVALRGSRAIQLVPITHTQEIEIRELLRIQINNM